MRHGLLVYNPVAGGQRFLPRLQRIVARTRAAGLELEPRPTSAPGHATEIVARALANPPDLVVAAGGDGTVAEAATALIDSRVPLAILPSGTANVLAREYGIGASLRRAERVLLSRNTRSVTAWRTNGHPCFMWMGVGLDARVMKNANPVLKRKLGRIGIAWSGIAELLRYDYPAIAVEGVDARGARFSREATFVVAANIRRYGGELQLSPRADPEDDLLDLTLFTGRSLAALARFAADVAVGRLRRGPVANADQLSIRTMTASAVGPTPIDVQIDGAVSEVTPVSIGPSLGRVQILVP